MYDAIDSNEDVQQAQIGQDANAAIVEAAIASGNATGDKTGYAILNAMTRLLHPYYTHPDVEEIAINRPGEVWLKRRRVAAGEDQWAPHRDDMLTFDYLERVCKVVANVNDQKFGDGPGKMPSLYASLPGGHRFSAAAYKNVQYDEPGPRGGLVMCIRQAPRADSVITFGHYGLVEGARVEGKIKFKDRVDESRDDLDKLRTAIAGGSHLIVSGATSTGKTTLLNRIISEISLKERVITVEDTRELIVPHPNRFHIVLSRTEQNNLFSDAAAINLMTRMTPDVIICGEISTSNAKTIWELTGTGHGSMMTTIHAEDPNEALAAFCKRMQHTDKNLDVASTIQEMKRKFVVVQIIKDQNGRRISAIETFMDELKS